MLELLRLSGVRILAQGMVMIELTVENLISLREAPRHLPTRLNGKRVHISAIYRWVKRGVRGVRLEALKIGGSTFTSIEALQRFADSLSAASPNCSTATRERTVARRRQIEQSSKRLAELLDLESTKSKRATRHRTGK